MSTSSARAALVASAALVLAAECSFDRGPDVERAVTFDRFPLYWLGETFEGHDLEAIEGVDGLGPAVVLIYGDCTPDGGLEPSCTAPIQIQIFPLCYHLDAVAVRRGERARRIRGAPLGTQDGAPVLLTRRTQIKVYRGEGTDPGVALRALEALRSLNAASPEVSATGPIPPPPVGVLAGDRPCTD